VREVTSGYLDEQNPLKDWLAEHYVITHWEGDYVSASAIRQEFMTAKPDSSLTVVKFKELMGFNGVESKRTNQGQVFYGIKQKTTS
jgi:hypothetical protein